MDKIEPFVSHAEGAQGDFWLEVTLTRKGVVRIQIDVENDGSVHIDADAAAFHRWLSRVVPESSAEAELRERIATLERWREETLDCLGHRTDQVSDIYDALAEFENNRPPNPQKLLTAISGILHGEGPLSSISLAAIEKKRAESLARGEIQVIETLVVSEGSEQ